MPTRPESDAHLHSRLDTDGKAVIEQAAAISGQSVTDFAVSTLLREAHRIIDRHHVTLLSARDRDIFLALIEAEGEPNEAIRGAAEEYKARFFRDESRDH